MWRSTAILISIVLIASGCAVSSFAQEAEDDETKSTKADNSKWEDAIPIYTFSSNNIDLFEFGPLSGQSYEGPSGTGAIDLKTKLRSLTGKVVISFFIENRIWGSPGMDGFALPRTSLNQNPITGKYYFEF